MNEIIKNYNEYIKKMGKNKYIINQICLDETNKRLVTLLGINKGCDGAFIDIKCPSGWKMSICGNKQVPKNVDSKYAHALRVVLYDNDDNEIYLSTKIRVMIERVTKEIMIVGKMSYSDINLKNSIGTEPEFKTDDKWYRFEQSFELENEDHLVMYAIEPNVDITVSKIKFALDLDMWECK